MGIFSPKQSEPQSQTCKNYLAIAPPGPRTEVLASCILQTITGGEVCEPSRVGRALSMVEVMAMTHVVKRLLFQDTDLAGSVARKAAVHWSQIARACMTADFGENIEAAYAAVGLVIDDKASFLPGAGADLPKADADAALVFGGFAFSLLRAATLPDGRTQVDSELYKRLFAGATKEDVELAYMIIATIDIMVGRLWNTGRLDADTPMYRKDWAAIPRMSEAGWYPNPNKTGKILFGESEIQRYWDGQAWSETARIRDGRRWVENVVSLHRPSD